MNSVVRTTVENKTTASDKVVSNGVTSFGPCIVIPYYNHPTTICSVLAKLSPFGLTCFVVNDASNEVSCSALEAAAREQGDWVRVIAHTVNQGKGGAVMTGCDAALAAGFSHALQIDADGQHNSDDVPRLLELARKSPNAVVTGTPIYDESVPRSRLYGRYVTHVWVWINTLSFQVKDSMCGLRVYPLATVTKVWRKARVGRRMDFDIEVMVRLVWAGVDIVSMPTRVTYPADGISHFQGLRDNLLISRMHAKLFFGMVWRAPFLICRRMFRYLFRHSVELA